MLKLVIFDLDGTLVDSIGDITSALNFAISPFGVDRLTVGKAKAMVGEGVTRLVEKILGPEREALKEEVLERFLDYYGRHLTDLTVPYPGVRETLGRLVGYRKAVISNKRQALSQRLLEELGLSANFDVILGSDSADEKKPSPKPLLLVLDMLSVKPAEAVIVGDSNFDIEAGKAAGVSTVGVTYGYREASLLRDADYLLDCFSGLEDLLRRIGR